MNFKKTHFKIAPSKNAFQNYSFKNTFHNCSLKKCISKLLFQKTHSKIAITKILFISTSINAVKDKNGKDKGIIMYD